MYEQVNGKKLEGDDLEAFYSIGAAWSQASKSLLLPEGSPDEIVEAFRDAATKMVADPEFKEKASSALGPFPLIIGEEAGYIHTARSRNDQVITDFKIWIRSASKKIMTRIDSIIKSSLKLAEKNIDTIMPGFTHLKNAQAISFAHYIMACIEMFERDKKRFSNNLESLSENPLGAAALTGTSFNIDRNYTSRKLGFKRPTKNSIDTVSDRDFVLDFLFSVSICSMHISRIAEELIIWNSDGFRLINLSDKVVTGSSIMPQKKNPDLLEFIRGKSGLSYGNLIAMLTILKGLPSVSYTHLRAHETREDRVLRRVV